MKVEAQVIDLTRWFTPVAPVIRDRLSALAGECAKFHPSDAAYISVGERPDNASVWITIRSTKYVPVPTSWHYSREPDDPHGRPHVYERSARHEIDPDEIVSSIRDLLLVLSTPASDDVIVHRVFSPSTPILGWSICGPDGQKIFASIDSEAAQARGLQLALQRHVRCFIETETGYRRLGGEG